MTCDGARTSGGRPAHQTRNHSEWGRVFGTTTMVAMPLLMAALTAGSVWSAPPQQGETTQQVSISDPMTPDQAAQALAFAQEHHPELASLLTQLKKRDPQGFDAAIRDLDRARNRLERMASSRHPERYERELEIWKLDSRIRLLVARSVSKPNRDAQKQIVSLLEQRNAIRVEQLQAEQDRLAARQQRLAESLKRYQSQGAQMAADEAQRLLRAARNRTKSAPTKPSPQSGKRPLQKKPSDKKSQPADRQKAEASRT